MFSGIAADNKHCIAILDIDPVVRHSTASERLCQSRNSGAVSDPCLVVHMDNTQAAYCLVNDSAFFVGGVRGSHPEDGIKAVDRLPLGILENKVFVAGVFNPAGDLGQGPVPVFYHPVIAVGRAVKRLFQAVIIGVHAEERRALGTKRTFVNGKVRVALCGNELAVTHIGYDLTADRTEGANTDDFLGAFYFEFNGVSLGLARSKPSCPNVRQRTPAPTPLRKLLRVLFMMTLLF